MAHTRRGTRIPVHISVTVTSLDATNWFSESGLVVLANQHGCAVRIPRPVLVGTGVILEGLPVDKQMASAKVVNSISLGEYERFWLLGLELHQPGNVWGIETPPNDWIVYDQPGTLVDRVLTIWQTISLKKKSEETIVH